MMPDISTGELTRLRSADAKVRRLEAEARATKAALSQVASEMRLFRTWLTKRLPARGAVVPVETGDPVTDAFIHAYALQRERDAAKVTLTPEQREILRLKVGNAEAAAKRHEAGLRQKALDLEGALMGETPLEAASHAGEKNLAKFRKEGDR